MALKERKYMDMGLRSKVAFVAGASKGLGKEVARGLAKEGARVAICARDESVLERTAKDLEKETGAEIFFKRADVSDGTQIKEFVRAAIDRFGTVHILVNNAGGPPSSSFMELNDQHWKDAFDLNFMSAVGLSKEVIPYMMRQRWGRIISLTSVAVKQPIDGLILSNSIRAAVHGWAKTLSNELASYNILVNCVCTGFMHTERVESLARSIAEREGVEAKEVIGRWEAQIPMGRLGRPEELANLVVFLASERAGYITGTSIPIDGGYCRGLL